MNISQIAIFLQVLYLNSKYISCYDYPNSLRVHYFANFAVDVTVAMSDISNICTGPTKFLSFVLLLSDGFQTTFTILSLITFIFVQSVTLRQF